MDQLIGLAKNFGGSHNSQPDVNRTGGQEYNSPHHQQQGGDYGPNIDHDEVVRNAQQQGSGDSSLFSSAMNYVGNNKQEHTEPIDEQHVQDAHRAAYDEGSAGNLSAGSMGSAAAMQVLKQFTGGGGGGGGGSQTMLISMAMAEATKLFDSSGGASSGNKQDAANSAAMTVMKLLVQSKFGGGTTGGGNSGGMGSLMGLASKFM